MRDARFDVVGIGNALVDVLSHEDDAFLERLDLVKGSMTLVETERADLLYRSMAQPTEMSGGSAGNTLAGVASFGGRAAYIGRVRDDELGTVFAHDLGSLGVHFDSPRAEDGPPTGRCMIIVTPDAQRTLNTYLGASSMLGAQHLDLELVRAAEITFLEGYLFDRPEAKEAYRVATDAAHDAGRKVALSLSDGFCVERHRDDFLGLVVDGVDILFANTDEITRLYGRDTFEEAVADVRGHCEIACLTRGEKGAMIVTRDDSWEIEPHHVDRVVDTTGAGDLYAAGFLYGYTTGLSLDRAGRLGSIAASAVIGHTGARPGLSLAQLLSTLET
ncbi:MAG: adenosine kinase [Acidimicrobiales bacterium]